MGSHPQFPLQNWAELVRATIAVLLQNGLKLANAALEKYPSSDLIKALKAIALDRSGKRAEANKVGVDDGVIIMPMIQPMHQDAALPPSGALGTW